MDRLLVFLATRPWGVVLGLYLFFVAVAIVMMASMAEDEDEG